MRIRDLLPTEPPPGMTQTIMEEEIESFGGNLIIYSREAYVDEPELWAYMGPEEWEEHERRTRRCWAARCRCTACGEEYFAGWGKGGFVVMHQGPDGLMYDGVPEADDQEAIRYEEGTAVMCPACMTLGTLVRKAKIHGSMTNQLMICSVENAGKYTALVYWLAKRTVFPDGDYIVETEPVYAAAIGKTGSLWYFRASKTDYAGRLWPTGKGWKPCGSIEPEQSRYYDRDACNGNLVGSVYWRTVPEQAGQTGEKTGLAEYIRGGGQYPLLYLRWWRAYPEVENLVKAGWTAAISGSIYAEVDSNLHYQRGKLHTPTSLGELFNWGCRRPCDLLQMGKQEEREARHYGWDHRMVGLWSEMVSYGIAGPGHGHAAVLQEAVERYGFENILRWESEVMDGNDWNLEKFDHYLRRQERRHGLAPFTGFELLIDYKNMLPEDATEEEQWPNDLRTAHDALAERVQLEETEAMKEGFQRIAEKWAALDWTDGTYCIRLARTNGELIAEGRTLHHCVGQYGPQHIRERVILFVRHHRRPERSWYTLNIDLTGKEPREVQLHGYGNEWAHGKQLRIPAEVLDFVKRWKQKVLEPVFRKVKKQKEAAA